MRNHFISMVNNKMENGYLNSLIGGGTPQARHSKSSFFQRSLITRNSRKEDTLDCFVTNNNVPASTSYSMFEVDGDKHHTSALRTHLSMDITEDITTAFTGDKDVDVQVDGMFQEFQDFYLSYPGEHEVFDLLFCYEELCSDNVQSAVISMKKETPIQHRLKRTDDIFHTLQNERNMWRILRILYRDRIEKECIDEGEMLMDTLGKRLSDKQIVDNLFLRNSYIRQSQLVVDWLEQNAADDFPHKHLDKMKYFSENSAVYEHTLHDLKTDSAQLNMRPTREKLITELDPDAPIRQRNNILHNTDKENEERLLKYMFICIRAGNLVKAQELAEKFGEPWLAAALEGWKLYHDPNYDNESLVEGDALLPVEGNKYRDVWKASCWRSTSEPRISIYEQAIYGAFSGNLKAILPACENWEDCLWAYVKVYIDKFIEHELRSSTHIERPLEELPTEYWDQNFDLNQIFQELLAFPSELVRREAVDPYRIIQKYIILDDVDGLIEELYSWTCQKPHPSAHLSRVMTHLILFFRMIHRSAKDELCVAIIESYIRVLIEQQKSAMVALYTSTLPPAHQVIWYAKFLEGITDNKERQFCLKIAEEFGLDIPLITKTVVENMRNKVSEIIEHGEIVAKVTTEDDKKKIEAIDWLVFDKLQRAEAMKQANALMRVFIANEKLDAAKQVFDKLPADSIGIMTKQSKMAGVLSFVKNIVMKQSFEQLLQNIVMKQSIEQNGLDQLSPEDDNATREYLCFRAYLEAIDSFNDWFQHYQHAKPKSPQPLSGAHVKFKEKVAYEHELKQYELELERWRNCLMAQTKTTSDRLYNVLLFVSGGWMVDQRTEGPIDENRQQQMSLLRKLCIPQITNLLHSVLYNTGQYKESVQLADIIASERYQLYKEFSTQELQQLLSTLRESSLALLEQNLDPLGYPFQ